MVAPKRKRCRPPSGGRDPHVATRMPTTLIKEIEAWAEKSGATRSEAIRQLVQLQLQSAPIVGSSDSLVISIVEKLSELEAVYRDKFPDEAKGTFEQLRNENIDWWDRQFEAWLEGVLNARLKAVRKVKSRAKGK